MHLIDLICLNNNNNNNKDRQADRQNRKKERKKEYMKRNKEIIVVFNINAVTKKALYALLTSRVEMHTR